MHEAGLACQRVPRLCISYTLCDYSSGRSQLSMKTAAARRLAAGLKGSSITRDTGSWRLALMRNSAHGWWALNPEDKHSHKWLGVWSPGCGAGTVTSTVKLKADLLLSNVNSNDNWHIFTCYRHIIIRQAYSSDSLRCKHLFQSELLNQGTVQSWFEFKSVFIHPSIIWAAHQGCGSCWSLNHCLKSEGRRNTQDPIIAGQT